MSDDTFKQLSGIMELYEINDFMQDEEVEKGLLKLVSILTKPDINPVHVARHVVACDALATLYAMKAKYYMTIGKDQPDANIKKNLYMTLREEFHKLADSLKYMVRAQT